MRGFGEVPRAVSAGASWLLLSAAVVAQEPPRFGADVELVVVDAVVLDGDGEPVAGLVRDDFEVRDEGEGSEILSFEEALPAPAASPFAAAPRRVSTNADAPAPRVVGVLWDDGHLSTLGAARAKRALDPWLTRRLQRGEPVVLASASGRLEVADGSASRERLLSVLSALSGQKVEEVEREAIGDAEAVAIAERQDQVVFGLVRRRFAAADAPGCRPPDGPADTFTRPPVGEIRGIDPLDLSRDPCPPLVLARARQVAARVRARVDATLDALARLVDVLGVSRGRKSIVMVSEGFVDDPRAAGSLEELLRAAAQANVAVAFLDPGGLQPGEGTTVDRPGPIPPADRIDAERLAAANRSGSERIARETGGLALRSNDLGDGLSRVAREADAHYLLGFAPAADAERGRLRRIEVKVRRPGLQVRARPVYTVGGAPRDPEDELRRVLDAPVDLGPHPLRVAAWVLDPRPAGLTHVVVGVAVGRAVGSGDPTRRLGARHVLLQVDGAGRRWLRRLGVAPVPSDASEGTRSSLVHFELELPAGDFRARVVLRDGAADVLGAVGHDFTVPPTDAPRMSTPLLTDEPLASSFGMRMPVPDPGRAFELGQTLRGVFEVYGLPVESGPGSAEGTWRLRALDGSGRESSGPLTPFRAASGSSTWGLGVSLVGWTAGDCELDLEVRDERRSLRVSDAQTLTIAPPAGEVTESAAPSPPADARPPADPDLARLLAKAGEYVVEYEQRFQNIVAEEEYRQWLDVTGTANVQYQADSVAAGLKAVEGLSSRGRVARRTTRADLVFVRLGPPFLWGTFRDVFEVDGSPARERDARLERLFLEPGASAAARTRQILEESAAYNIGTVVRTINVPTLPLVFLHPQNQARFAFERKGRRRIAGIEGVEVRFEETSHPTFVRRELQADLPARGSFWVDPGRGTVLRSRIEFELTANGDKASIETRYRPEPGLALWVPSEMQERYAGSGARARYSNFRRFGVQVDERVQLPEPEEPE